MVTTAIMQNRFSICGRSRVSAEVVHILNTMDIRPELISFSAEQEIHTFRENYNADRQLDFTYKRILPLPGKRGHMLQIPLFNILSRKHIRTYDLIFNSNSCCRFLPRGPDYIHYIHFDPQDALITDRADRPLLLWKAYTAPIQLLYLFSRVRRTQHTFLANSEFTLKKTIANSHLDTSDIDVVYPPAVEKDILSNSIPEKIPNKVVSLGAFTPVKRQREQINIASLVPEADFTLIGTKNSPLYFRKCEKMCATPELSHVSLMGDCPSAEIIKNLREAAIFLHTRKNEHFGISTVEAAAMGCVPVVHDSGGSKEIVTDSSLRFSTASEAAAIIKSLLNTEHHHIDRIRKRIKQHLATFTQEQFRERIRNILKSHVTD